MVETYIQRLSLRDFMFREKLNGIFRDVGGRCWGTNHVWNAVRNGVYVIAIWAGHLSLLYVNLADTVRKEEKGMMALEEDISPRVGHGGEP